MTSAVHQIAELARELRARPSPNAGELLEELVHALPSLQPEIRVQDLASEGPELYLTLVAPSVAAEVREGDYVYGGLHVAWTTAGIEVAVRIYRVACQNGLLADTAEGRRLELPAGALDETSDWRRRLGEVVAQAFAGGTVDEETRRFRTTLDEMVASPYELLCHLSAQGLICDEEQAAIQRAFDEAGDASRYGLINAVTSVAHRLRDRRDWQRAAHMERLGGEILRGDHQPPLGVPVWA